MDPQHTMIQLNQLANLSSCQSVCPGNSSCPKLDCDKHYSSSGQVCFKLTCFHICTGLFQTYLFPHLYRFVSNLLVSTFVQVYFKLTCFHICTGLFQTYLFPHLYRFISNLLVSTFVQVYFKLTCFHICTGLFQTYLFPHLYRFISNLLVSTFVLNVFSNCGSVRVLSYLKQ